MKLKLSTLIIILILINIIAVIYKALTINVKNDFRCIAKYEIFVSKYNKHIDEIIRGSISDHIIKEIKVPRYDFSLTGSSIYDVWRIREVKSDIKNCETLKQYVINHIKDIDKKITTDLNDFKNDIKLRSNDPVNFKLVAIIKSKESFIQIYPNQISTIEENTLISKWIEYISTLVFLNVVYMFLVFLLFIISKKFSFFKFK